MEFGENGAVIRPAKEAISDSTLGKHAYLEGPRSALGLFKWMSYALYAYMVAEFLLGLSSLFLLWLYLPTTEIPFAYDQLVLFDYAIAGSGLLQVATLIFAVIMVSRFTYRTMRNLHTIGNSLATMSPAWAVGWYFIPFANLWKPAEGMSQIYHGTHKAVDEPSALKSPIPFWWIFWLLTNFAANISFRLAGGMTSDTPTTVSFSFDIASSVFAIIAGWALIRLSRRIAERQELIKHGGVADVFA